MARCPHINRAPIYDRCYDKQIYSLYLCRAKHLVTELSIFWLGNGVERKDLCLSYQIFLNF